MKFNISNLMSFIVFISFFTSCSKYDIREDCYESVYLLPSALEWLPYYSVEEDTLSNTMIKLKEDSIFVSPKNFIFINNAQDTQYWNLEYAFEKFNFPVYSGCPKFQEITFVLLNDELVNHFEISLLTEIEEFTPTSVHLEFTTNLQAASCKTDLTTKACAFKRINLTDELLESDTEFLSEFVTSYTVYQEVYKLKIVNISPDYFKYTFFIAKGHGLVAYEFENVIWELKI